jgi:hypothetical protein
VAENNKLLKSEKVVIGHEVEDEHNNQKERLHKPGYRV